jgi:ankyrin repeat protein
MRTQAAVAAVCRGRRAPDASPCATRIAADLLVHLAHVQPRQAEATISRLPLLGREVSSWGETCLQAAAHLGHRRLAMRLLEMGIPSDLYVECALGDPSQAAALVRTGETELRGVHLLPILHFAVASRDPAVVETLLESGAPVNPRSASLPPLHSAVAYADLFIVRCLLEAGADPLAIDAFGETALDWAISLYGDSSPLAALLVRSGRASRHG